MITFPDIDPVAVKVGPLAIKWYGLAYVAGFALAYVALQRMIARSTLRISRDALFDLIGWLAAGVMIGGRLGWWLFYHRPGALDSWYEPIAVWHGGMSFHGGVIGVAMALLLWCWKVKVAPWNLADSLALVAPIGLFLGRIANFINAELVGRPTTLPWGVLFPGDTVARHPSQFYEAILEGIVLLVILWLYARKARPHEGQIAGLFLILYGVLRFVVEFARQPDEQVGFVAFGWITMGQVLSIALALAGVLIWTWRSRHDSVAPTLPPTSRGQWSNRLAPRL